MNNTPLSAIKAFCISCLGDQPRLVKGCTAKSCPLYPYRTGHNTTSKRTMTDEQRRAVAERLKKDREAKNTT